MAFDNIFKLTMRELLKSCNAKAEKVGTLPLEIDTVARCNGHLHANHAIPILVTHFSEHNLLEYKSERDKPTGESLSKLLGYVGLYCDQHGIPLDEITSKVTAWYITARRPAFLDGLISSNIARITTDTGVYEATSCFPCPCRVVICDELDVTDANIPLLLLGSLPTIKQGILQLARAGAELRKTMGMIISTIYVYYHDKVKDMTEMSDLPADMRESIKHAIEHIGLKNIIDDTNLKNIINDIGISKVIDAVGVDKVIDAVGVDKLEAALARREAREKGHASRSRKAR